MKCTNCGHENREGVKFCEECGQPLAVKVIRFCSNCGHENRAGVKFCEECGTDLATGVLPSAAAGAPAAPPPVVVQVTDTPRKRRFNPLLLVLLLLLMIVSCCCLLLLLGVVQAPAFAAPVVAQAQKILPIKRNPVTNTNKPKIAAPDCTDEMDRLKNVNLNGIVTCVGGVDQCNADLVGSQDYKGVELEYGWDGTVQGKAACSPLTINGRKACAFPFDRQSNRVDFWLSIGECRQYECWSEGWLPGQVPAPIPPVVAPPPTCKDRQSDLESARLGEKTSCFVTSGQCTTEITGKNYQEYEINYQWEGGGRDRAECVDTGTSLKCTFPYDTQADAVAFYANFPGCLARYLGYSDGWLEQTEAQAPEPPVSKSAACCEVVESKDVALFREPPEVGTLYLGFKLTCDQPWILNNGVIDWDAYVGAEGDILWTSGSCKYDGEDSRQLECEGAVKDQKKSRTKIVLDGCPSLDIEFQSPYYAPPSAGCASKKTCFGVCCPNASDSCDTKEHPCSPN